MDAKHHVALPGVESRSMSPSRSRVIVGLSGGVDSAVAALLLREQGRTVQAASIYYAADRRRVLCF